METKQLETKRIDFEKKEFVANGVTYSFKAETMSIERFIEFERLQAHVGFGKDFKNIYDKLKTAYGNMNKSKVADAAVIIHNLLNGIAEHLDKRDHPILQLCALFVNSKDEDKTVFDEGVTQEKIDNWKKEGYAIEDFFQLAFNFVEGFIPAYNETIQDISQKAEEMVNNTTKKSS